MTGYYALTLWQPWASLVAIGGKPLEFRAWPAPEKIVGKRLAIHAAARAVNQTETRTLLVKLHSPRWRETGLHREKAIAFLEPLVSRNRTPCDMIPLGAVLALATCGRPLKDAELAEELGLPWPHPALRDGGSSWGWPLDDVRPFVTPRPAIGEEGIWRWRPDAQTS